MKKEFRNQDLFSYKLSESIMEKLKIYMKSDKHKEIYTYMYNNLFDTTSDIFKYFCMGSVNRNYP